MEKMKFSLIGRLDFKNLKFAEVKATLLQQWKLTGTHHFIPMTKGYFTIVLSNDLDKERVWKGGIWTVGNQVLKVQDYHPRFNPTKQRTSKALVWVQLPSLPILFWTEEILLSICTALGSPMAVDSRTLARDYGYYARVFVDVDFAKEIPSKIKVNAPGYSFFESVSIPKVPKFCNNCKIIGHSLAKCKVVHEIEKGKKKMNSDGAGLAKEKSIPREPASSSRDFAATQGWTVNLDSDNTRVDHCPRAEQSPIVVSHDKDPSIASSRVQKEGEDAHMGLAVNERDNTTANKTASFNDTERDNTQVKDSDSTSQRLAEKEAHPNVGIDIDAPNSELFTSSDESWDDEEEHGSFDDEGSLDDEDLRTPIRINWAEEADMAEERNRIMKAKATKLETETKARAVEANADKAKAKDAAAKPKVAAAAKNKATVDKATKGKPRPRNEDEAILKEYFEDGYLDEADFRLPINIDWDKEFKRAAKKPKAKAKVKIIAAKAKCAKASSTSK